MNNSQKISISVHGATDNSYVKSFDVMEQAGELGRILAEHDCITSIPSSEGFAYWVSKGAYSHEGQVVAFSPAANRSEHVDIYGLPTKYTDMIIYSGFGNAGADLLLSRSSDAIIFGYGGLETAHDFWVAFQENKPIGILKGEWETEEILFGLLRGREDTFDHSRIIFDRDPRSLVEKLIKKAKQDRVARHKI